MEGGLPSPPPLPFPRVKLPDIPVPGQRRLQQASSVPAHARHDIADDEDIEDPLLQGRSKLYQRRKEFEAELRREFELSEERAERVPQARRAIPPRLWGGRRAQPPPIPPIPHLEEEDDVAEIAGGRKSAEPAQARAAVTSAQPTPPMQRPQSWRQQRGGGGGPDSRGGARAAEEPRGMGPEESPRRAAEAEEWREKMRREAEAIYKDRDAELRRAEERQREEAIRQMRKKKENRRQRREEKKKEEAWENDMRQRLAEELKQQRVSPAPSADHEPERSGGENEDAADWQERQEKQERYDRKAAETAARRQRQVEHDAWMNRQRQKMEHREAERQRRIEQQEAERRRRAEEDGRRRRNVPESSSPPPEETPEPPEKRAHGRSGRAFSAMDGTRENLRGAAYMRRERDLGRSTSLPAIKKPNSEELRRQAEAVAMEQLSAIRHVANRKERQKAFKDLLRAWHPDKNPDSLEVATSVFQRLQAERKNLGF